MAGADMGAFRPLAFPDRDDDLLIAPAADSGFDIGVMFDA